MDKNRRKHTKYNAKSALVIKNLANKYEVTEDFVRKAITNARDSETAVAIKKNYARLMKKIEQVLS